MVSHGRIGRDGHDLEIVPDAGDKLADELYERETGRSNFVAFLLGGVVVAGGMLAFLYYDSDGYMTRDGLTTSSLGPSSVRILPADPSRPAPPAMD